MSNIILNIALWALPVLLAITVPQAIRGYVALRLGDTTARDLGRISFNPLAHVDLVGTIIVPLSILLVNAASGGNMPMLGWGKTVPVDFGKLRRPKADMLWVSLAGPLANIVMAFLWVCVWRVLHASVTPDSPWLLVCRNGVLINLVLLLTSLIPIPPFDGGRILVSLLPMRPALALARLERYGFFVAIALLLTGVYGKVIAVCLPPILSLLILLTGA